MQVSPKDILFVAQFVQELTGVVLDETKAYLVESRLSGLARTAGCASYQELCQKARSSGDRRLQDQVIDAITTHETLFFRDNSPFEALRQKVVPELVAAKARPPARRKIRIWSAACSTGQEPYSIAMTLWDTIPDVLAWDVNILGTDISDSAVTQASLGRFSSHEIQRGMNPAMLAKFFRQEAGGWKVKDELRSLVSFRRCNLLDSLGGLGPFDVIFCRNVAIYFSGETRRNLFLRLADHLTPDGYLFVGASESLSDLGPRFAPQYHGRTIHYRPNRTAKPEPVMRPVGAG
ncbi:MAG: protein-glutamate O-methyltransferase CheR [Pirellulales bacterium]|nr:protein-glutamate O-methyltransferase CheR [Pirellulales bacterium]